MGRQIQFHALPADIQRLLEFAHERDPVIVALRDSNSPEVSAVSNPAAETHVMTLWNQGVLSGLQRRHVVVPGRDYYSFDSSLPTLELSPSLPCKWNGREALLSGRIYGTFDTPNAEYGRWFNSLVRWIRRHFVKSFLPSLGPIGQAAYDWYKAGGVLLPMMIPPAVTASWLSWVQAQDQHRAVFAN